MDYKVYQERVLGRASHRYYHDKIDKDDLRIVLEEFIEAGQRLDRVKKSLMYGRDFEMNVGEEQLPIDEVSINVKEHDQRIIHAALGVATEGVELIEAVHARLYKDKSFDAVNLQEEFGDVEWYRAFGLATLGQSHEDNLVQNDNKLEKRFGSTFTEEAANTRNLDAERVVLERKRSDDPLDGYGGHYGY